MVRKIISGGQTGADQGALDGALACDFPHGGAVPAGRKTEAGPLSKHYRLEELESPHYPERTEKNVVDSDGTLILSHGKLSGGSALTRAIAQRLDKPWLHIDCATVTPEEAVEQLQSWCAEHRVEVLNVAGPRASMDPLIYGMARQLIIALLLGQQRGPHASV
jgi:hypothetical protein